MPDVILIGAGPAGCAAAFVLARSGADVLLLTSSLDTVCLAASGEVHAHPTDCDLFRELDLAGAVKARELHRQVKWLLEQQDNVHLLQSDASELMIKDGKVQGVRTWEGPGFLAPLVGLCAGSFLAAELRAGQLVEAAGRPGQMSYPDLTDDLKGHGIAFSEASYSFELAGQPATVNSLVLAPESFRESHWLVSPAGLAAAGYCADAGTDFAAAARAGQSLGEALGAQARAVSTTART